ncbi:MAG TPA: hypothetical protein VG319_12385 [Polyangia bacterium]|jgi:hypothetical protein|nr:hypothetical protein [Polyangia bacterium]
MEEAFRVLRIAAAAVVGVLVLGTSDASLAKEKSKGSAGAATPSAKGDTTKEGPPPGETVNACGCYHDAKGACVCTDKKGKCECPGECEPVGCAAKRDKEMEREMAAEIKRAQADEKKRAEAQEAQESGATGAADAGESPAAGAAKPAKSPRKAAAGKPGNKPETK